MDGRLKRVIWGRGNARVRTSEANWRKPLRWNAEAEKTGKRAKVFCASLAGASNLERGGPWDHLWLGTSAEDQAAWDERVPILLDMPARSPHPRSANPEQLPPYRSTPAAVQH